ncbi:sensor histidine kinase [Pseudoroseicyclus sp. CXY001]|uniref:sensor histidine kinase n=1 Tax=Pseudoroseicyclus sp. CXY001 TaxID=3242492 RepID=UPI00358DA111
MTSVLSRLRERSHSLTFRIAALMALALLPIGLISVNQTYLLLKETDKNSSANLLSRTAEAAAREASHIQAAFGAARMLAAAAPLLRNEGELCEAGLARFLDRADPVAFVGYVSADGIVQCASDGVGTDVSERPSVVDMVENPRERAMVIGDGAITQRAVVAVGVPVISAEGDYNGFVTVSLEHGALAEAMVDGAAASDRPINLVTFNASGEILTAGENAGSLERQLPANADLANLARIGRTAFIGTTESGQRRFFAVVPIEQGVVFALGSWAYRADSVIADGLHVAYSLLFPAAMWLAGLAVAFFSVQAMVIKPTRNLRARMLMFMRNRRIIPRNQSPWEPQELVDMDETWQLLAESVLRDEAELHNSIHQKTVLLKEVHHRVKNNLQLIASIINMKMRKMSDPAERRVLVELQHRVASIARVHQKLYETSAEERVRADELFSAIVEQTAAAGVGGVNASGAEIDLSQNYEEVVLYPDQAVPMGLALSELVMNAFKYIGAPEGETPWIAIDLHTDESGGAVLDIRNSVPPAGDAPEPRGDGLGSKLVNAFARQLGGTLSETNDGREHRTVLSFPIAAFQDAA